MAMNVYKNAPLDYRIESRFVKRPGETRNFKWSLMWSFNSKESALAMLKSLRNSEGDNPIEEYRITAVDSSFTSN